MDEFEQAVMALYSPETSPALRAEALRLFDQVYIHPVGDLNTVQFKRSPDGWVMCAQKFISKFYLQEVTLSACLQVGSHISCCIHCVCR